ncbi:unnamed protein product [Vitrella brassicaformis CCMP3155]|uniref:Uncharacterized protein n=1 Tax=Vitrella brassicaformis (strain CCMP3155) TaxID=1169540 RepID=A0A0G4FBQ8_VITBC|nr:unnamed protein product [Vitrella brassicaformis CCMP3155]|eukprot:CEM10064.1 unnamed protein product [Vitrella brassicaformis CCMP3155]
MALFSRLTLVVFASLLVAVWMPSATVASTAAAPASTTAAPPAAVDGSDIGLTIVDEQEDLLVDEPETYERDEGKKDGPATSGNLRALGPHDCRQDRHCRSGYRCWRHKCFRRY